MDSRKMFKNAKWIVVCKVIQSALQLVIGMITARYLGPANYGLIGYANSVVSFMLPFMQLGLHSTLVKELIETPEREGEILGTSIILDLASGIVCIGLVNGFVTITNAGEFQTRVICALSSIVLLFRALEIIQYWFQYRLQAKFSALIALGTYIIISIYRIYLLATSKNLIWFALVHPIEYCLVGCSLIIIYKKLGGQKFSFSLCMAKRLLNRSRYYIVSAAMVTIFQNTDHIMLMTMVGETENGIYTSAVTCAGVMQFVYMAVIDSFRPIILERKKQGNAEYENNIIKLYSIILYMSLFQGIVFSLFARRIILILYGAEYLSAVGVFKVFVWQIGFSYMGSIRNIWILAEGKQKIVWKLNFAGAFLNVVLNAMMIPRLGAYGAAFMSLITQIVTNFVFGFVIKGLKRNNELLLKALNPKVVYRMMFR